MPDNAAAKDATLGLAFIGAGTWPTPPRSGSYASIPLLLTWPFGHVKRTFAYENPHTHCKLANNSLAMYKDNRYEMPLTTAKHMLAAAGRA